MAAQPCCRPRTHRGLRTCQIAFTRQLDRSGSWRKERSTEGEGSIMIRVIRTIGLTVLLGIGLSFAAMAQGGGAIGGTVVDGTGGALPGVTLTLSNPGAMGDNLTTVSDAQGAYQFPRLLPGTYSVKGELSGFQTVVQGNIVVNAART